MYLNIIGIMDIIIFVLRTIFLVLIYVFIYIIFIHLVRDLRDFGTQPAGEVAIAYNVGKPGASTAFVRSDSDAAVLTIEAAPDEYGMGGTMYELLSGSTRLGRSAENDVVLPDRFASNSHAVIHLRGGQYWLEDLGSRNGTFLNSMPLTSPAVLANSDQIRIGDIIFRFVRWDNAVEQNHRTRTGQVEE